MDPTEASAATVSAAPSEDSHKVSAFTVITLLIGLIGVCGNGVVLSVIYRSRKTKKSRLHNAFVVNQTALDLVSSVFLAMTFIYKMAPTAHMEGSPGLVLCICLEGEGLLWIFLSASAFSLMSLTFERYIKIVFPIRHHNSFTDAKKAVLLAMSWLVPFFWLLAFILVATKTKDDRRVQRDGLGDVRLQEAVYSCSCIIQYCAFNYRSLMHASRIQDALKTNFCISMDQILDCS
ncbi:hypothetical protein CAPTEDRAFT_187177 [Capitella teleta]|uniref:G-protein coupled receptors family 1 profile domain-containing protein n=1 Tax=Capitella teleta TaxID=283909 RepID=R7VHP8_CAPTE|nr:hypothetical protein CAPTEDRAFT_187177 [Capitella teleta]|eukprot:ELU15195.1 hypothetical protein CAPTEDRAFT_187177 [Capitella teleta]